MKCEFWCTSIIVSFNVEVVFVSPYNNNYYDDYFANGANLFCTIVLFICTEDIWNQTEQN